MRQPETGNWLLNSEQFLDWVAAREQTLFCPGIPGAGKSVLTSVVVDFLESKFDNDGKIAISYIYCDVLRQEEQTIHDLLKSLLKQLIQCRSSLPDSVRSLHRKHNAKRTRPTLKEISALLQSVMEWYSRIFIIVDALDQFQALDDSRTRFLSELFNLQIKYKTNIFATSRHIPEIVNSFKANLSREIEIRANPDDVAIYLKSHIGQLPSCVKQNRQLQDEIITGISGAVDGMYVLVIGRVAQN
jgi:Cdc6-like AAA superfamily ATPase